MVYLAWMELLLINKDTILVGTLGKAFGTFGAFVAAKQEVIEWLIQKAHSYIYTTAIPPTIAEATRCSLSLIKTESERRQHLNRLIEYFRSSCKQLNFQLTDSNTPIQPILIGSSKTALHISNQLLQKNILVPAIRPPTVPSNTARLRITFCSNHTESHIDQLLSALSDIDVNN